MSDSEKSGMTAREAVEQYCTHWTWAGTVSDDPKEMARSLEDAARKLGAMLHHEIIDAPAERTKRRIADAINHVRDELPHAQFLLSIRNKVGPDAPLVDAYGRRYHAKGIRKLMDKAQTTVESYWVHVAEAEKNAKEAPDELDQFSGPDPIKLWATGYRTGADPNSPREAIRPEFWLFDGRGRLKLDIDGNRAHGGGIEYVDLRIFDAEPVAADPTNSLATPDPYRSGAPGRPSGMHLVDAEFQRRIDEKANLQKLSKEAAALLQWYQNTHKDGPPLTVKTIKEHIRTKFRSLPLLAP